ncbi:hypothetical protein H0X06_04080 [Candidatus Dependentiae bacterium]|nr:hypothetical protein [Candidatus Dependentiae bacterium]
MIFRDLASAVADYKEKSFVQWYRWSFLLFMAGITSISCIHLFQVKQYLTATYQSAQLTHELVDLTNNWDIHLKNGQQLKALKPLSLQVLPNAFSSVLLCISQTIPDHTFITSLTFTAHKSIILKGYSPTQEELLLFTKALSSQSVFPCRVHQTLTAHPIGISFDLSIKLLKGSQST